MFFPVSVLVSASSGSWPRHSCWEVGVRGWNKSLSMPQNTHTHMHTHKSKCTHSCPWYCGVDRRGANRCYSHDLHWLTAGDFHCPWFAQEKNRKRVIAKEWQQLVFLAEIILSLYFDHIQTSCLFWWFSEIGRHSVAYFPKKLHFAALMQGGRRCKPCTQGYHSVNNTSQSHIL